MGWLEALLKVYLISVPCFFLLCVTNFSNIWGGFWPRMWESTKVAFLGLPWLVLVVMGLTIILALEQLHRLYVRATR